MQHSTQTPTVAAVETARAGAETTSQVTVKKGPDGSKQSSFDPIGTGDTATNVEDQPKDVKSVGTSDDMPTQNLRCLQSLNLR